MVLEVFNRKLKRVFPVMVEGTFFKRVGVAWKQARTYVDRQIGYQNRKILSNKTPVKKNQIMFITFQHDYACNPKYICEELLKEEAPVEIYWALNDVLNIDKLPQNDNFHVVKINSYDYFKAAASSRVIVINSLLGDKFYPFPVKKDQYVYETWHGSLGIKRFDLSHYNTNMSWPVAAVRTGKLTNFCISNSTFEEDVFRETFWQTTPILRLGHARNDIFFDGYEEQRKEWKHAFLHERMLPDDTKLALYAPTFRDTHNFAVYDLAPDMVIDALKKRFGGNWKLLLRYHDNDKKTEKSKNNVISPDVIDVTAMPDIQELLAYTDVGITDYSSWIYDFILSRRPGFIYARDIKLYNNERGFYFKLEESPFPVAKNNDQLYNNILNFDKDAYLEKVQKFLDGKGCMDDGHASERIAANIMKHMK